MNSVSMWKDFFFSFFLREVSKIIVFVGSLVHGHNGNNDTGNSNIHIHYNNDNITATIKQSC